MLKLPSRLRRLDEALADLPGEDEPMMLTELDGFLAGVLVCREPIPATEWLPLVWGYGGNAPFEDAAEMRRFTDMLTAYHDEIARQLARGRYRPLYDIDDRNGDILWELWADGFGTALTLRPESWIAAGSGDDPAAVALAGMATLAEIAGDRCLLPPDTVDRLTARAPDHIPGWIATLHDRRVAHAPPREARAGRTAKIGRNDPCACGSGRKAKRCCGERCPPGRDRGRRVSRRA